MDFRCTKYCKPFERISDKKDEFLQEFRIAHPRTEKYYNHISSNSEPYKLKFVESVYSGKCVYCGNDLKINDILLFEIDHYKPQKLYPDMKDNIDNLVASCKICNRAKSDFDFTDVQKFDLETGFPKLFIRDELFNIKISNEYIEDNDVQTFYKQMGYSLQRRRLDFLLLVLHGMNDNTDNVEIKRELLNAINLLMKKRNKMGIV